MIRFHAVRSGILRDWNLVESAAVAAVLIGIATAARWLLGTSADPVPFVTYFPAIVIGALLLGWKWAAFITIASGAIVRRWFLSFRPIADGDIESAFVVALFFISCALLIWVGDTLRRSAREADNLLRTREILLHESLHRNRNTLAIVDAVVRLTDTAGDVKLYRDDVLARLRALADANQALVSARGSSCDLRDLSEAMVKAFAPDRFKIEGAPLELSPIHAQQLGLMLHELATNAVKHGALSVANGWIRIAWSETDQGKVSLVWSEHDGPAVVPPARSGLGTRLLRGNKLFDVETRFDPDGLRCDIEFDKSA